MLTTIKKPEVISSGNFWQVMFKGLTFEHTHF